MIEETSDDPLSLKEIKVRIPVSFHLKLHAFKALKGKPISDTIVEALDAYFKAAEQRKAQAHAHAHADAHAAPREAPAPAAAAPPAGLPPAPRPDGPPPLP